jgi:glucokinase
MLLLDFRKIGLAAGVIRHAQIITQITSVYVSSKAFAQQEKECAMTNAFLAVDIGATKAALAIVDDQLKILNKIETPTGDSATIWADIEQATLNLIAESKLKLSGVGIGSAGPINLKLGSVSPVNIKSWKDFPIVESFSKLLRIQNVSLCGDAIALALAESKIGFGKDLDNFLGMVVSTGIGGGLVINGKIHHGNTGNAGYFGHHAISYVADLCECGRTGCVELYASGPKMVENALTLGWTSPVHSFESLASDARLGSSIAIQAIDLGTKALAVGIVNVLSIMDINTVIIGGGVSKAGAIYWDRLIENVKEEAKYSKFLQEVDLRPSSLNSDAGLIGAAILAMEG